MAIKEVEKGIKPHNQNLLRVAEPSGLMSFLIQHLPGKGRNTVKSILAHKQVSVNGNIQTHFDFQLKPTDEVAINRAKVMEPEHCKGFRILYEDAAVIVIDKDAGLLSMATERENLLTAYSILSRRVKRKNPDERIFIVHRLDRDTSGVMMFAKTEKVQSILQAHWNENVLERTYLSVVEGNVTENTGRIRSFLKENKAMVVYSTMDSENGLEAITHYKVLKRGNGFSLLELELETGRKNQIRVHLKDIGHSVVGDEKYGSKQNPIGRLGLHAKILAFRHPVSGKMLRFETPIPPKFSALFQ
jgi:23S rRNA pseudouridine1911/1915/1917 synthase